MKRLLMLTMQLLLSLGMVLLAILLWGTSELSAPVRVAIWTLTLTSMILCSQPWSLATCCLCAGMFCEGLGLYPSGTLLLTHSTAGLLTLLLMSRERIPVVWRGFLNVLVIPATWFGMYACTEPARLSEVLHELQHSLCLTALGWLLAMIVILGSIQLLKQQPVSRIQLD